MHPVIQRLKERKLVQWTLAYLAGAWATLEILETLRGIFGWGVVVAHAALALLGLGLVATWILAWYHGEQGRQRISGSELIWLTAVMTLAGGVLVWLRPPTTPTSTTRQPRIVVLPLENLGEPEDEYFADGMTDEISSRLAEVPQLSVIGRTSAMQYKATDKSLERIGQELGVEYVLGGTVRWSTSGEARRLRITPELIRVEDESQIWSDRYDATFEDVFAVQSRIAQRVVAELGIRLGSGAGGDGREVSRPTASPDAYEAYLRGNALYARCVTLPCDESARAATYFREAVELDPEFAAAWARLSLTLNFTFEAPPAEAVEAAENAMRLAPTLPSAHVAAGVLQYMVRVEERDNELAEASLRRALQLQPGHPEALRWLGIVLRRQGRMEEAVELLARAADLDPRNPALQYDTGATYVRLRQPDDAERYMERYLALEPNRILGYRYLAIIHRMRGSVPEEVQDRAMRSVDVLTLFGQTQQFMGFVYAGHLLCDGCEATLRDSLSHRRAPSDDESSNWHRAMDWGRTVWLAGDSIEGRRYLEIAARQAESAAASTERTDPHPLQELGVIYALLGEEGRSIASAREALDLVDPVSMDPMGTPGRLNTLAEAYARFGHVNEALGHLETLLAMPSLVSAPLVRINPAWDRVRDDPRLEALLERYPEPVVR